jgi:hypothetical protein
MENVCPNCGGGFEKRPSKPISALPKYQPKDAKLFRPINRLEFEPRKNL